MSSSLELPTVLELPLRLHDLNNNGLLEIEATQMSADET